MWRRTAASAGGGIVVAVLLFLGMQALISRPPSDSLRRDAYPVVDFVRLAREEAPRHPLGASPRRIHLRPKLRRRPRAWRCPRRSPSSQRRRSRWRWRLSADLCLACFPCRRRPRPSRLGQG